MKRKFAAFAALALALLLFAGCAAKSSVKLGEYKGLSYTPIDTTVTDEEVDEAVQTALLNSADQLEDTSRTGTKVQTGDVLWIDFVGYMNGVAFEGGDTMGEGMALTIGSGQMVPGFEDALIGETVGETVSIDVTFPDPYSKNPDFSGKDATFDVTIHYVIKYETPAYTDAFVEEYTNGTYTTKEDFEDYLYNYLTQQKESDATGKIIDEIRTKALANCTFDIKNKERRLYYNQFVSYYEQMAQSMDYTLEEYLSLSGSTQEQFASAAAQYAQETLCQRLFYQAVAKAEGLTVTDEEFEARIDAYLAMYGYTGNREGFEKAYDLDLVRESMLFDIVNEHLIQWSVPAEE